MISNTLEKWEEKTLGEILDKGSSNLSANKLNDCVGIYPVYGASGLIVKVNFYQQDKEYLAIIKDGAGVGRVYHYQPKTSVLGTLQYLYPKPNTNIRFAYYYLQSIDFAKYYQGAAIPHIYYRDYKSEKLVLPPLPEQERIVAKLDKAFEAIDKVKANAEQNLNNAKELFKSALNKAFTENTDGWEEKTLNDVSCNLDSKRIPITKNIRKTGHYPYYGASGVVDYVEDYIFDGTFLLISEDGANLLMRNYPIAFSASGKFWVNNHAHILKFNELITQRFVELYLNHINIQKYITGAAQPKLTQNNLNSIKILFPSLSKQQKIVEKLDALQEQTKQLEAIYTQKIKECDELKQSILQKAFRGEL